MNINLNKILTSPKLATSFFVVSGAYKTYKDYQNADAKYKNRFLIKDTVVLLGATVGILACNNSSKYFAKLKPVKNLVEKIANKLLSGIKQNRFTENYRQKFQSQIDIAKEIAQNTLANCSIFVSGIVGAFIADYLLGKCGFKQPKMPKQQKNKPDDNFTILKNIDNTMNQVVGKENNKIIQHRITDMPQLQVFANGIIGAQAIDLSKERKTKKRLEQTTHCLINNSLIPMFLLSTSSVLTRNLKPVYKIPIIFLSLVGGTIAINKIHEKITNKDEKNAS